MRFRSSWVFLAARGFELPAGLPREKVSQGPSLPDSGAQPLPGTEGQALAAPALGMGTVPRLAEVRTSRVQAPNKRLVIVGLFNCLFFCFETESHMNSLRCLEPTV